MMERILVPLDGSPASEAILPFVELLARRVGAEVLLFRAVQSGVFPVVSADEDWGAQDLRPKRMELIRQGVRARTITRAEGAVPAILQTAREERVSLIAMATHGKTGLAHLLLGGICEGVLRGSPVPVFAVRPFQASGPARPAFRNILVPLDDTGSSLSILPAACAFASLFGSRLVFLHVAVPGRGALAALGRDERERAGDPAPPLENAVQQAAAAGIRSRILVDTGDVRDRILARVRSEGIDLIAMTTHGRSTLSRLLFGSVSEGILRRAEVPLLLCREQESPIERRAYGGPRRLKSP